MSYDAQMNAISWVVLGLIIGIGVHLFDPHAGRGGLLGAVLLGISGAVIGGSLITLLFGMSLIKLDVTSLATSMTASVAILFMGKLMRNIQ